MLKFKRRVISYAVAYCAECKGAVVIMGKKSITESGRQMLTGPCPQCGLELNRLASK